jgi:hypothetical protein
MASNGNLTLTGTVWYGTERTAAGQAVAGLTGVQDALNRYALMSGFVATDASSVSRDGGRPDVRIVRVGALGQAALCPVAATSSTATTGSPSPSRPMA